MRILLMADTPADPNRGAAGTEVQTVRALRALGHDVDAIWADDLGHRIAHGNLHQLLELPRTYASAALRALRAGAYDVVHVNQPHGFRAGRAVHRVSPRTVFIHRSHGLELNVEATLERWRKTFKVERRSLARRAASALLARAIARHSYAIAEVADGHIVSSSLDADYLADRLRVDRARIAVVPQAPPDNYVHTPALPMTRERYARVLHVAQFAFFKAPMITTRVIQQLSMPVTWVCDRAHHATIRSMLSDSANARLELLHWMTQDELRAIYDAHGFFLFPSFFEGFGKAFLEAMSRGLVVVASDVGGMHDVMRHDGNGLLVPPGDADAITNSVRSVDLERATRIGAAAARSAREYTWNRVAGETAAFYEARLRARNARLPG